MNQDCVLHSTATRSGAIAAHHRDTQDDDTGFSFVNCTINGTGRVYLGRAWGTYSRAIYSYCDIDNIITPSGWNDWNQPSRQKYEFSLADSLTNKTQDDVTGKKLNKFGFMIGLLCLGSTSAEAKEQIGGTEWHGPNLSVMKK